MWKMPPVEINFLPLSHSFSAGGITDLTLTATIMMQLSRNPNPTKGSALCSRTGKVTNTNNKSPTRTKHFKSADCV